MRITDKQREICENRDWQVTECGDGEVELINFSPAGENLVFYVENDETFVDGIKRLAAEFNPDEHAEMWIEWRGKNGVPSSIRQLIDDADAIDEMLKDLATALAATVTED